jgi:predicted RNA binding protein YcfA (HicA-like mRNA interferase family)
MSRRVLSGREVRSILEANGFSLARMKGSHIIMQRKTETGSVTVPVPDHKQLAPGTLASIIRQSGLPRELFES